MTKYFLLLVTTIFVTSCYDRNDPPVINLEQNLYVKRIDVAKEFSGRIRKVNYCIGTLYGDDIIFTISENVTKKDSLSFKLGDKIKLQRQ